MRIGNEYGAKVMSDHPKRFGLFAGVPLPDLDGVMKEIEYGLDKLKADGIGIYTNDNHNRWPGDPYYDPMWQELNRRKAIVYMHPMAPQCCRDLNDSVNPAMNEFDFDITRACTSILANGVLHRYPEVRIIIPHSGGTRGTRRSSAAASPPLQAFKQRRDFDGFRCHPSQTKKNLPAIVVPSPGFRFPSRKREEVMKIIAMMALAVTLGIDARADQVTVYVQGSDAVPMRIFSHAQSLANGIFRGAGVNIDWRRGQPPRSEARPKEAIVVEITTKTPQQLEPGALAFARPYEGVHIDVFYDRVQKVNPDSLTEFVLAHVLVHEITHILQGISRQSETGVMKAHWNQADYMNMRWEGLPFTEADLELIRVGLAERAKTGELIAAVATH